MSKTNIQSFHKSDSQGWLLQACHGTVNLALDSWTHSFLAWYVPGAMLGIQHRHSYCPAIQTGWEKQAYKQSDDAEATHCHKSTWRQVLLVSE